MIQQMQKSKTSTFGNIHLVPVQHQRQPQPLQDLQLHNPLPQQDLPLQDLHPPPQNAWVSIVWRNLICQAPNSSPTPAQLHRFIMYSLFCILFFILGILINGGGVLQSAEAEIYIPPSNTTCSLPKSPEDRFQHTQDGGLACGGHPNRDTRTSCDRWTAGSWTRTHTLREQRASHSSWSTAEGVFLIGGENSPLTTELVKQDGSVEEGFVLKYNTK